MINNITEDIYKKICKINTLGHNLIAVEICEGKMEFFLHSLFVPSEKSSTTSVNYCTLRGKPITTWIENIHMDTMGDIGFNQSLLEFLARNEKETNMKFSEQCRWIIFTS